MASTFISRTFSGTYNKGTISMWLKRSALGSQYIFYNESASDSNDYGLIMFDSSDRIEFMTVTNGTHTQKLITNRVFRDTSAFYHFVFAMDTDNSTADNRLRIYVNGVEETSYDTRDNGSQGDTNYMFQTSATNKHRMFASSGGSACFDGLATHIHIVPNSQLAPTVFGETDSTSGIWKPKTNPSVTYTAQGAFLKFENSGNLDLDSSGNNLTFTTSGTLTQNVDTPSNNYATLNGVASNNSSSVLTNGNLTHTSTTSWVGEYSSLGANAGKWYAEGKITDRMNYSFGVIQNGGDSVANISTANNNLIGKYADGWGFAGNDGTTNNKRNNNTNTSYGEVFSDNDIFMICLDVTGGKIYFGRNGSWFNSSDPASGANPAFTGLTFTDSMHFASGMENGSLTWNFGQGYFGTTAVASANSDANGHGIFEYAVPSGFYALNTKNLKEFG